MKLYPELHNIEYMIELGWDSGKWKRVTNELLNEGKIHKIIKHTYFACRNEDGTIKTGIIDY